jgi:hypothetical protein
MDDMVALLRNENPLSGQITRSRDSRAADHEIDNGDVQGENPVRFAGPQTTVTAEDGHR